MNEYGALYDKLPISAFLWKEDVNFDELLPLDHLQLWNSMSYHISVITKSTLNGLRCDVLMKNGKFYPGSYLFTVDSCGSDPSELDTSWSELP